MTPSPEMLAAYADGELSGEALQAVEAALRADPALQRQVDAHRALKARLAGHFGGIAAQPVPEHLLRAVQADPGGTVVEFRPTAKTRARVTWGRPMLYLGPALAASLVLVLVGLRTGGHQAPSGYASGEIAAALEHQLVGTQASAAPVRVLLTFRDAAGAYCRGYASAAQSGIACHDERGWKVRQEFGGSTADATTYRQAGSAAAEVMATIQEMAAGPALDATEEREAAGRGWEAE